MPKIWKTEKSLHLPSLTVLEEQTWGEFEREAVWGSKEKISSTDREADSLFFDDLPSTTRFKLSGLRIHDPHVTVPCMTPVLEEQTRGKPGQTGQYLEFCKAQTIEAWCTRVLVLLYMGFFSFFLVEPALHVRNGKSGNGKIQNDNWNVNALVC